jgi:hypothetical protein
MIASTTGIATVAAVEFHNFTLILNRGEVEVIEDRDIKEGLGQPGAGRGRSGRLGFRTAAVRGADSTSSSML